MISQMGNESKETVTVESLNALRDLLQTSIADLDRVVAHCEKLSIVDLEVRQLPKGKKAFKAISEFTTLLRNSFMDAAFKKDEPKVYEPAPMVPAKVAESKVGNKRPRKPE